MRARVVVGRCAGASTRTASSRSRPRCSSRATAARSPRPFVTHSQRARPGPLPAHRDRALPEAPDRRRPRARLRDRQGLPQRGRLVQAQPEFTMLEWYEAYADYEDTMVRIETLVERGRRARSLGTTSVDLPRPRDRPRGAVGSASGSSEALDRARALDRATRASCARWLDRRAASTPGTTRPGRSSSTTRSRHFVEPELDPADDPLRLPDRALARSRARDDDDPTSSSASSTSSAAWSSATRTAEINDAAEQAGAVRPAVASGRRATASRGATRTTSRRSRTGCRRPAGSGSGSTGSRCCSPAARRSATSSSSRPCAPTSRQGGLRSEGDWPRPTGASVRRRRRRRGCRRANASAPSRSPRGLVRGRDPVEHVLDPCSYTSAYGTLRDTDDEPVSWITFVASSAIEMRFVAPTLKISPDTSSSISPAGRGSCPRRGRSSGSASPSPWISSGRPSSARCTKRRDDHPVLRRSGAARPC